MHINMKHKLLYQKLYQSLNGMYTQFGNIILPIIYVAVSYGRWAHEQKALFRALPHVYVQTSSSGTVI